MSENRCPVRIRGVIYISQRAAAAALGLHPRTITKALNDGYIDDVGLRRGGHPGKPCVYRGKSYPSRDAAAKACGVSRQAVTQAVKRGQDQAWELAA